MVRTNVTFILENNITLHGHSGNNRAMIDVSGGTFRMRTGSVITGNNNTNNRGGAVSIIGTFEMTGGTISGNAAPQGGGIDVSTGTSTIAGGTISGNAASQGGGVYVGTGTFTMTGSIISGNTASQSGGGVYVGTGTFEMAVGTISGNIASQGGGAYLNSGTFNMRGGTITGNTATNAGGGVFIRALVRALGIFSKTGGIITGYNTDQNNGNVVRDNNDHVLTHRGHTVAVGDNINTRKETTAGPGVNLFIDNRNRSGVWDQ